MSNSKISALTAATTPLAGTEVLPVVQSGITVKATVANITGSGAYAGSFSSLAYTTTLTGGTGIVNLGSGQFYKDANGNVGIGTTSLTGYNLRLSKNITGAATSYGFFVDGTIQSDVTTNGASYATSVSTAAAAFTLNEIRHYDTTQATIGAGSVVSNQYAFIARSTLTGATTNYGFTGNLTAVTSGIATTGTITSISSSTTTVTINHNAITYTNGQTVTISATANATALTSGATCTILTVGTTDFTLIGAASNTVGVSFTATGAGTGSGTVTLNVQGSGKTVAGAASGSFTYTTTTSQTFAAVTVLTGSVTVSNRYNLYMAGSAPNYLAGNVGIGVTPAVKLDVLGTIQAAAAATQDAVRLAGRAGGTGTYAVTLTPTTLTASRTLTLPDATTTVVGTDATQTLTNKTISSGTLTGTLTAGGGVGTSGQFLQSTATGVQWAAATGVLAKQIDIFTSGAAATYTAPANTQWVKITVVGKGGNGGGTTSQRGSGGGAGGIAIKWLAITAGQTLTYTVNAPLFPNFVTSGTYTLASDITAYAGTAGTSVAYAASFTAGGLGGSATGGDINIRGGYGGSAFGTSTAVTTQQSGFGGSNMFGAGGYAVGMAINAGVDGLGYGVGGSGSIGSTTVGLGTNGVIIFEAY